MSIMIDDHYILYVVDVGKNQRKWLDHKFIGCFMVGRNHVHYHISSTSSDKVLVSIDVKKIVLEF